jgi:ribosomal protein S18 acetylase RimI-like enzyme
MSTFLTDPDNVLIVAEQKGFPIGFILGYQLMRCDGDDPMMLLYEIEVCAQNRRAGAGRLLVEALQDHCRKESISKMWVLTNEANTAAVLLYQATGGVRAERGAALFEYHFDR